MSRTRHVVVAALSVRGGRVLLAQRRADQPFGLLWELPGGKIEDGETPEAALERELQEELDVACEVGRVEDVIYHRYPDFDVLILVFRCRLLGDPRPKLVEQVGWFAPAEAARLPVLPADAPLFTRWLRDGLPDRG